MAAILTVDNINVYYGSIHAIKGISFEVNEGEIVTLIGANGAGKSTTIRLLMGALQPDSGRAAVLGVDTSSPEFLSVKEDVGVVLDEAYYPEVLNAAQVGKVMAKTYRRWDAEQYKAYLQRFDLPLKKAFKDFSRGMKMKLAIAVAMSHSPKLLVLDEATGGLDPIVRDEILDIFNDFTRDESHSILISSHIVSDLEKICDYIAFLHRGRLVFAEEKDMLYENYALVNMTKTQLSGMPKGSVLGSRENSYGAEVLMLRSDIPAGMVPERITIEDIMLYMAREER